MLVRNTAVYDTRVRKEAEALAAAGYEVRVLALAGEGLPLLEEVRGVSYLRIRMRPWHPKEARRLHAERRRSGRAGTRRTSDRRPRASRRAASDGLIVRLRRRLEAPRSRGLAGSGLVGRRLLRAVWRSGRLVARTLRKLRRSLLKAVRRRSKRLRRFLRRRRPRVENAALNIYGRLLPLVDPLAYSSSVREALSGWDVDVVHAHDLGTLHAGYRYARKVRRPLVYDSHELELDRNTTWTPLKRLMAVVIERRGIRAAAAVITVSESISRVLAERYRIAPPLVLLNSPSILTARQEPRRIWEEKDGITADSKLIAIVGGVWQGRGLEQLIEALRHLPEEYVVVVLGPRKPGPDGKFVRLANRLGVAERLHFFDPLPAAEVPSALATVDVCAIPIQKVCLSYDYSMPNKLFDAVMAGIPIAVANLSEMKRFVLEHALGRVFDETDPVAIANTIREVVDRPPEGIRHRERLSTIQEEICWERQAALLIEMYGRLLPDRDGADSSSDHDRSVAP